MTQRPFGLTYVWHDCFVLHLPGTAYIIFDYWFDPREPESDEPSWITELKATEEPVYILVSHHHKDHFVSKILDWSKDWPEVHYVISKDVARMVRYRLREDSLAPNKRIPPSQVTILRPGESITDGRITVQAYASTDTGNSYVIETGGLKVFHAGDLNAWIWKDESTPKEVLAEIRKFDVILEQIATDYPKLDIAMMPVDSRIGTDYFTGAKMLVDRIDVDLFVPMHFGLGTPEEVERHRRDAINFPLYANPKRGRYVSLTNPGDSYLQF